eukprot:jgi/Ulvmu1/6822/UM031_0026.1
MVCTVRSLGVLRLVSRRQTILSTCGTHSRSRVLPTVVKPPQQIHTSSKGSVGCRAMEIDTADAVDVTRHNFDEALQSIKAAIEECDFVAFDCEMTGLFLDNNEASYLDDMPLRYYKMHASARRFLVNQFGVSAFSRSAGGGYTAKTFNLNIFPRSFAGSETRFTSQASSLEYLAQHNFDFNKMVYDGIPYLQLSHKRRLVQGVDQARKYFRREPTSAAARRLIEDTQATVTAWHAGSDATVTVARGSRPAERAFAYQALEELQLGDEGSPGFYAEKVGDGPDVALLVTRATKAQLEGRERQQRQERLDTIEAAAGFSHVIAALKAAGKPVVGHNMLFDLIYVLNIFVADFPTWRAFKAGCMEWFPGGVYDTKHITRALDARHADGGAVPLFDSTTLGDLYEAIVQGKRPDGAAARWRTLLDNGNGGHSAVLPSVEHAEGFTRYAGSEGAASAHEAGFDAFMTGAVFANLLELKRASDTSTAAAAATPELLSRPTHPAASSGGPDAVEGGNGAQGREGASVDLAAMAELLNRVNVMRTNLPHCVVSTAADPEVERPGVVVLATAQPARLPDRKAAYGAFASGVAQVGRVPGLRLEEVMATGPWAAWAANMWGHKDQQEYSGRLVALLRANNGFRKCQFMTWAQFEEWKRTFPEIDPYSGKQAPPVADESSSGDEGMLQWVLKNNCAVM